MSIECLFIFFRYAFYLMSRNVPFWLLSNYAHVYKHVVLNKGNLQFFLENYISLHQMFLKWNWIHRQGIASLDLPSGYRVTGITPRISRHWTYCQDIVSLDSWPGYRVTEPTAGISRHWTYRRDISSLDSTISRTSMDIPPGYRVTGLTARISRHWTQSQDIASLELPPGYRVTEHAARTPRHW